MDSLRGSVSSATTPARVCLYCCIPTQDENRDRQLSPSQQLRRTLRRAVDDVTLRTTGRLVARFFDYQTATGSNIGDIAIRTQIRSMLDDACGPRPIDWMEVAWGALDDRTIAQINETCDALVIGGGAYFHLGRTGQISASAQRFLADRPFLAKIRIPIVCLAVGASAVFTPESMARPSLDEPTSEAVQAFLKRCSLVSVRDHTSAAILPPIAGRRLTVVPDPALYAAPQQPTARPSDQRKRIGLNLAFSGSFTQHLLQEYLRPITEAVRAAAARHDADIVYFAHVSSERIVPHWLNLMGLRVEEVHGDPATIMQYYRGLDIHVGSMMHSCVFALANNVPTVALAYDIKLSALFESLGLQSQLLSLPELHPDTLCKLIDSTITQRKALSATIDDRRRELRPSLDQQIAAIARLIEEAISARALVGRPQAATAQ